jgi:integrase/recombinase XerD
VPVRALFKWLARSNRLLYNPASELELPKLEQRLPRGVLSAAEAEAVLAAVFDGQTGAGRRETGEKPKKTGVGSPETGENRDLPSTPDSLLPSPDYQQTPDWRGADPLRVRDRAILEVFYSTGVRRFELIKLKLYDVDAERGTLVVREGKGKKDRMVPIGERAAAWVAKYLEDGRPSLAVEPDDGTLFLTVEGAPFTPNRLTQMVRGYVNAAGVGKKGACHLFRHTMATLMLEGGADIRFIQQMLGHAKLETTQIYTQVSIRKLKEIHAATHPGARLVRRETGVGRRENQTGDTSRTGDTSQMGDGRLETGETPGSPSTPVSLPPSPVC